MWESMGKPNLEQDSMSFQSFSGTKTESLGKIYLKTRVQNEAMYVTFHVANYYYKDVGVLLGRTWMYSANCQINLVTRHYALEVNSVHLIGKGAEKEHTPIVEEPSLKKNTTSTQQSTRPSDKSTSWIRDDTNPRYAWKVSNDLLHSQGYGRGESKPLQCWLPKKAYQELPKPLQPEPIPNTSRQRQNRRSIPTMRWVPKSALKEQGYYQGNDQLWLPKKRRQTKRNYTTQWLPKNRPKTAAVQSLSPQPKPFAHNSNLQKRWIPKATLKAQGYYEGNEQIWIPKLPKKRPTSFVSTHSPPKTSKVSPSKQLPRLEQNKTQCKWVIKAEHNKEEHKASEVVTKAQNQLVHIEDPTTSSKPFTIQAKALLLQQVLCFIKKHQSRALESPKALQG